MGLYLKPRSPFWWMLLEGTGRQRESTGIPWQASTAEKRKDLKAQAEDVYHARMVGLAREKVGLPKSTGETFETFSAWYETHHTAQHRGAERERAILGRLRAAFNTSALRDITEPRWKEYETTRLAAGVGINTIGRELAVMKTILRSAVGEHLASNPLAELKRRTIVLPPKRTLSADEDRALLEQLRGGKIRGGTYGDDELHDLYLVGVGTLLRQMNLIMLTRAQVHGARLVTQTKTGPHQVALAGPTDLQRRAATALTGRLPADANGPFFPKWQKWFAKDRNAANAKFLQAFRRACKRAGIPWGLKAHGVVWHTATRASGATRMLQDYGIDLRTVQMIGGWRSLDQMAQYLGVDVAALDKPRSRFTLGSPTT